MSKILPIQFQCPVCGANIPTGTQSCTGGHTFKIVDDIFMLLHPDFEQRLIPFLTKFEPIRAKEGRLKSETAHHANLPYGPATNTGEWRLRRHSLRIISRLLPDNPQKILEIGSWNGWLSNQLSSKGHMIVAADIFKDDIDGLLAYKHYPNSWIKVQMDLSHPKDAGSGYDMIILNHCFQFLPNQSNLLNDLKGMLGPDGKLVLLGLPIYDNPRLKAKQVSAFKGLYKKSYGFDIFFYESKGYLNKEDETLLKSNGIDLKIYMRPFRSKIKSLISASAPVYYFGVYKKVA